MHAGLTDAEVDQVIDASARAVGGLTDDAPRQPLLRARAHHGPLCRARASRRASGATSSTAGTCTTASRSAPPSHRGTRSSSGRRPASGGAGPPGCATTWSSALPGSTCSSSRASRSWVAGRARAGRHDRLPLPRLGGAARRRQPPRLHRRGQGHRGRRPHHDLPLLERVRQAQGASEYEEAGFRVIPTGSAATSTRHRPRLPLPPAARRCAGTGASSATG